MVRYSYENWTRYAIGMVAFCAALLLTPRALLEIPEHVDSHEITVNLLQNSDDCLWCTPRESRHFQLSGCDVKEVNPDEFWLDISELDHALQSECDDVESRTLDQNENS